MCGIAGLWLNSGVGYSLRDVVGEMTATLHHRGPDGDGVWVDAQSGVGLGHRRLSIVDLSPAGAQPMTSVCGRYTMVFNGEIYNYRQLRAELEAAHVAPIWRGHSDTEVMLAAVSHWGLDHTLMKLVGMFAIALWDRELATLSLVRDRMGEKPLYFGLVDGALAFASELKAFRYVPGWRSEIDRDSLALYLDRGYVPAPKSIYANVSKVLPGSVVSIIKSDEGVAWTERAYWSLREHAGRGVRGAFQGTLYDAVDELERLLRQSIADQMIADVPVGAFLSGGVDSSSVVAIMRQLSNRPIDTFTIGVADDRLDETASAHTVAAHLGTTHYEHVVTPSELLDVVPEIPAMYDEPFADSSQIPTYLVAKFARSKVTVALSGDGGDELFGGYMHYVKGTQLWNAFGWLPAGVRRPCGKVLRHVAGGLGAPDASDRLFKLAGALESENLFGLYRFLTSQAKRDYQAQFSSWKRLQNSSLAGMSEQMYADMLEYLPDDILTKVDRACMAVSLESRIPLLDHRIVEFAWSLPMNMKIRGGQGKLVLRTLLSRYVPNTLIGNVKKGFSIPIDDWLRGPLREWADSLLDPRRLENEGCLDARQVNQMWQEHLSGRYNWQHGVWNALMFQIWHAEVYAGERN